MTETMLTRMARAMFQKYLELAEDDHSEAEREAMFAENEDGFIQSAKAALEAIREPSDKAFSIVREIEDAQPDKWGREVRLDHDQVWEAFLDAILQGEA